MTNKLRKITKDEFQEDFKEPHYFGEDETLMVIDYDLYSQDEAYGKMVRNLLLDAGKEEGCEQLKSMEIYESLVLPVYDEEGASYILPSRALTEEEKKHCYSVWVLR